MPTKPSWPPVVDAFRGPHGQAWSTKSWICTPRANRWVAPPALVGKGAHEFFLPGVHRDHRLARGHVLSDAVVQVRNWGGGQDGWCRRSAWRSPAGCSPGAPISMTALPPRSSSGSTNTSTSDLEPEWLNCRTQHNLAAPTRPSTFGQLPAKRRPPVFSPRVRWFSAEARAAGPMVTP